MLLVKAALTLREETAELVAFIAAVDERRLASSRHKEFNCFSGAGLSGRDRAAGEV